MTAAYVPIKGDRIRRTRWLDVEYLDVIEVGRTQIFGVAEDGDELMCPLDGEWIKVKTPRPLPEQWLNAYEDWASAYSTRELADGYAADHRIALVHIWTDADGVDRIERVTA